MYSSLERAKPVGLALVVEDDSTSSFVMLRFLQRHGVLSHVAENGAQCLDLAENFSYDIILLDSLLPDVHASEVIVRLRTTGMNQRTLIIGISADGSSANERMMREAGCDEFLVKPLNWPSVSQALSKWPGWPEHSGPRE